MRLLAEAGFLLTMFWIIESPNTEFAEMARMYAWPVLYARRDFANVGAVADAIWPEVVDELRAMDVTAVMRHFITLFRIYK